MHKWNLPWKKKVLADRAIWYSKSLDPAEKEKLLSQRAECYKSLDPKEKEKLLSKSADWYKSLGSAKKNILSSRAIWNKSLVNAQIKKIEQNGLTCSILHRNKKEWNGISH